MQQKNTNEPRQSTSLAGRLAGLSRDQRTRFLVVGVANTVFATVLFAGLVTLFGKSAPSVVFLSIVWVVSLFTGYFAHRLFVFRAKGYFLADLMRFTGVNYISFLINFVALWILADLIGLPPVMTQTGIILLTVTFNYFGHKYFSFWRKR